jgi:hypothetical protein
VWRSGYSWQAIICDSHCGAALQLSRLFEAQETERNMGRGILLWLLGVPIPIIILLALLWH